MSILKKFKNNVISQITVTEPEDKSKDKTSSNEVNNKEEKVNGEVAKPKVVYSDSDSSDDEDDRELQGRTYSDKGIEVSLNIKKLYLNVFAEISSVLQYSAPVVCDFFETRFIILCLQSESIVEMAGSVHCGSLAILCVLSQYSQWYIQCNALLCILVFLDRSSICRSGQA